MPDALRRAERGLCCLTPGRGGDSVRGGGRSCNDSRLREESGTCAGRIPPARQKGLTLSLKLPPGSVEDSDLSLSAATAPSEQTG